MLSDDCRRTSEKKARRLAVFWTLKDMQSNLLNSTVHDIKQQKKQKNQRKRERVYILQHKHNKTSMSELGTPSSSSLPRLRSMARNKRSLTDGVVKSFIPDYREKDKHDHYCGKREEDTMDDHVNGGRCVIIRSVSKRVTQNPAVTVDVAGKLAGISGASHRKASHDKSSDDQLSSATISTSNKSLKNSRDLVRQTAQLGEKTKQFCEYWSVHNDQLDTTVMRDRVVHSLLDRKSFPTEMTFSTPNFPIEELTLERFVAVYRMIDHHFFNMTLDSVLQRLARERGYRGFEFIVKQHIPDEHSTTAFYELIEDPDHPENNFVGIVCHASMWTDRANRRQVDGIPSPNKLYALVSTLTHEICHSVAHLLCDNAEHDQVFRSMNRNLFGASPHSHTAIDY